MVANGFDGVPWMIGGGDAKHSANIGRVLAYAATSGSEGVIAPGDLKVSPSSGAADAKVHIATGACAIRNRYGNARSETYIARGIDVSDLTIGSTGSSGRSDLIVAHVQDPQYGAAAPADLANGPYIVPEVIPGVPATTKRAADLGLSEPMYELARIDIPPNTTAITAGMIVNLRKLVLPRTKNDVYMTGMTVTIDTPPEGSNYVEWAIFPKNIDIPYWATNVYVVSTLAGIQANAELIDMYLQSRLGTLQGDPQRLDLDNSGSAGAAVTREMFLVAVGGDVTSMAGTTQKLSFYVQNSRGNLYARPGSHLVHQVYFYEATV